jgi:hypothetical protein
MNSAGIRALANLVLLAKHVGHSRFRGRGVAEEDDGVARLVVRTRRDALGLRHALLLTHAHRTGRSARSR